MGVPTLVWLSSALKSSMAALQKLASLLGCSGTDLMHTSCAHTCCAHAQEAEARDRVQGHQTVPRLHLRQQIKS